MSYPVIPSANTVAAADITDATLDGIALMTSADANPFTDADESKLDAIEDQATADQTGTEIEGLLDTELSNTDWKRPVGTTAGTVAAGDDSRLSDARTPTAHASTHATGEADALAPADIGAVADDDARLSDARTPTAHASTHAIGQADALSPSDIGAEAAGAAATVQGNLNTHTGTSSIHTPIPAVISDGDITTGTSTTQGTITAAGLKLAAETHGITPTQTTTFTVTGDLAVGTGNARFYFNDSRTLIAVRVSVNTAPTGADIQVDVNKNGTTIFTTQSNRPIIAATGFTDVSGTPEITTISAGDYLTIDIDQVGSTVAGADLVVSVYYQ